MFSCSLWMESNFKWNNFWHKIQLNFLQCFPDKFKVNFFFNVFQISGLQINQTKPVRWAYRFDQVTSRWICPRWLFPEDRFPVYISGLGWVLNLILLRILKKLIFFHIVRDRRLKKKIIIKINKHKKTLPNRHNSYFTKSINQGLTRSQTKVP